MNKAADLSGPLYFSFVILILFKIIQANMDLLLNLLKRISPVLLTSIICCVFYPCFKWRGERKFIIF